MPASLSLGRLGEIAHVAARHGFGYLLEGRGRHAAEEGGPTARGRHLREMLDELGPDAKVERLQELLVARYGEAVGRGTFVVHHHKDLGATLASGSHRCESMVIVPCSMKTLAGVAHGLSHNLIERAADVMLKEKRRLVIVPRETPLSLPQLRNMVACAEADGGHQVHQLAQTPGFELGAAEALVENALEAGVVGLDGVQRQTTATGERMDDGGTLYALDASGAREAVWAAFTAPEGAEYDTVIEPCTRRARIASTAAPSASLLKSIAPRLSLGSMAKYAPV